MSGRRSVTPEEIIAFWFPDDPNPDWESHMQHWVWRMQGGANEAIMERYVEATEDAAMGRYDDWTGTPDGRLALIILLDQFPRTVWAGTPRAFAQDPKALEICLEGLKNGHYDALERPWYKGVYRLPLEHCECPDHLANIDKAIALADALVDEVPDHLRKGYAFGAGQPRKHRAVIARFGRHAHRNGVLGRQSTPEEQAYIEAGEFPHEVDLEAGIRTALGRDG